MTPSAESSQIGIEKDHWNKIIATKLDQIILCCLQRNYVNKYWSLFVLLLLVLTSCSAISLQSKAKLRSLLVTSKPMANNDMVTSLDIVFVKDKLLVKKLPGSGLSWFEQRQQWLADNSSSLTVLSLEIPPNKRIKHVSLPSDLSDAYHVVVYTKYFSKGGQSRLNLTSYENAYIDLWPEKVTYGDIISTSGDTSKNN